jgi:DNA-directed RNA polymerase specialized sigma24 family protein
MTREEYAQAYQDGVHVTFRFLLSRGVGRDSAEENSQAAWMRGWEHLDQLRSDELLTTWVNTIALNLYRRSLRRERKLQFLQDLRYASAMPNWGSTNWAAIDVSRILSFCRLSDRLLLEAQMDGMTAQEMADQEGVSQTAIRIRLLRARRAARKVAEGSMRYRAAA